MLAWRIRCLMEIWLMSDNARDMGETKGVPEVRTGDSLLKIVKTAHECGDFDLWGGGMMVRL